MKLQLTIQSGDGGPLPEGGAVHIEIRDTSLADAPAVTLKRVRVPVPKAGRPVAIQLPSVPDGTTVYAHLDADGDGRVSRGDYVTVESYPVTRAPEQHLTLRMRQVR